MSKTLFWNDSYNVGNIDIDNQHRELFSIANEVLSNKIENLHNKKAKIREILHKLFKYMSTHFSQEEELMQSIGYPDYEKHKKFHQRIIDEMNDIIKNVKDINELENHLYLLMDDWLLNHILTYDKKIGEFLNSNDSPKKDSSDEEIVIDMD